MKTSAFRRQLLRMCAAAAPILCGRDGLSQSTLPTNLQRGWCASFMSVECVCLGQGRKIKKHEMAKRHDLVRSLRQKANAFKGHVHVCIVVLMPVQYLQLYCTECTSIRNLIVFRNLAMFRARCT